MPKKRRVKLVLEQDEAAVVAPVVFWEHLNTIYDAYEANTNDAREIEEWQWAKNLVTYWVSETKATTDDEDF